jgi:hypothetical protein
VSSVSSVVKSSGSIPDPHPSIDVFRTAGPGRRAARLAAVSNPIGAACCSVRDRGAVRPAFSRTALADPCAGPRAANRARAGFGHLPSALFAHRAPAVATPTAARARTSETRRRRWCARAGGTSVEVPGGRAHGMPSVARRSGSSSRQNEEASRICVGGAASHEINSRLHVRPRSPR